MRAITICFVVLGFLTGCSSKGTVDPPPPPPPPDKAVLMMSRIQGARVASRPDGAGRVFMKIDGVWSCLGPTQCERQDPKLLCPMCGELACDCESGSCSTTTACTSHKQLGQKIPKLPTTSSQLGKPTGQESFAEWGYQVIDGATVVVLPVGSKVVYLKVGHAWRCEGNACTSLSEIPLLGGCHCTSSTCTPMCGPQMSPLVLTDFDKADSLLDP